MRSVETRNSRAGRLASSRSRSSSDNQSLSSAFMPPSTTPASPGAQRPPRRRSCRPRLRAPELPVALSRIHRLIPRLEHRPLERSVADVEAGAVFKDMLEAVGGAGVDLDLRGREVAPDPQIELRPRVGEELLIFARRVEVAAVGALLDAHEA